MKESSERTSVNQTFPTCDPRRREVIQMDKGRRILLTNSGRNTDWQTPSQVLNDAVIVDGDFGPSAIVKDHVERTTLTNRIIACRHETRVDTGTRIAQVGTGRPVECLRKIEELFTRKERAFTDVNRSEVTGFLNGFPMSRNMRDDVGCGASRPFEIEGDMRANWNRKNSEASEIT